MEIEKYLKACFPDVPHLQSPIDISEEVLKALPKRDLGIFTDPVMRNIVVGASSVILIFFVSWFKLNSPLTPANLAQAPLVMQIPGGAKIQLTNKTTLFLKENSQFETKSLSPIPTINLIKGEILVSVIKPHPLIIHTPHLKIQVGGTLFKVLVDEKITEVKVLEGEVMAGDFLVKQFEKAVCGKEILSFASQPLLPQEIENLKQEFVLADLYIKEKPDIQKGTILWREVK